MKDKVKTLQSGNMFRVFRSERYDGKYIKLLPLSKKELKDAKDFDKFMY